MGFARSSVGGFIKASGTTIEHDPIIKSDGVGEVFKWLASTGSSSVTIDEDASNILSLSAPSTIIGSMYIGHGAGGDTDSTAVGDNTLDKTDAGALKNTAIGANALTDLVDTDGNTALGYNALKAFTGDYGTAIGYNAAENATSAVRLVAIGKAAAPNLQGGDNNTCVGASSLGTIAGTDNVAVGYVALNANSGSQNTALGRSALQSFTGGNAVAVGYAAADSAGSQTGLTAVGRDALGAATSGNNCTALGYSAGSTLETGADCTLLGASTAPSAVGGANQTVIGASTTGVADNSVVLGNASVTAVYAAQDSGATVHCAGITSVGGIAVTGAAGSGWVSYTDGTELSGYVGSGLGLAASPNNVNSDLVVRAAGKLAFCTDNALAAKMSIDTAGLIGCGTTLPGKVLNVAANDTTSGDWQARSAVVRIQNTNDVGANDRFAGCQFAFSPGADATADNYVVGTVGAVLTDTSSQWSGDLVFGVKAATTSTTISEAMRIATGGLASFTPGTNTAGINVTTAGDPAYGIKLESGGAAITNPSLWVYNNGASTAALAFLEQDQATATGDVLHIQNDGSGRSIYVEGGGIVEEGGVLKSNLLTNSGFDVWSNSTLENVATIKEDDCASDDTGDWTLVDATLTFDTDHYEVATTGGTVWWYLTSVSVTAGKLYKVSVDIKSGTGSTSTMMFYNSDAGGDHYSPAITTTGSFVTHTFVFEQSTTATDRSAGFYDPTNFSGNIEFKNFIVTEVTPGCVSSGDENVDGWQRRGGTATKCWRQHGDGSAPGYSGSFYSLKTVSTTSAWNHAWPDATLITDAKFLAGFAGRKVTAGCWVYSTLATPEIRLNIYTGSDNFSTQTVAQNTWTWLEATATCPDALANFQVQLNKSSTTSETYYVTQPMLVFGSAIGSGNYSRPSGEIINVEKGIDSNLLSATTGWSDSGADIAINLEADSDGKIPKGAAAVRVNGSVNDSGSAAQTAWGGAFIYLYGLDGTAAEYLDCRGVTNDAQKDHQVTVKCDANGDIKHQINATGSATFDIPSFRYSAIQLR